MGLPLAFQPLVTSHSTTERLTRTVPMRLAVATDLRVTGILWSMHYTMMVGLLQVEKSFLQNEGGCRDGVNYEKGCQQEDASADNKNHTSIPTSFFLLLCIKNVWLLVIKYGRYNIIMTVEVVRVKKDVGMDV